MAKTKIGSIAPDFCAGKLKPLADATRLTILELLIGGPKHVGEINAVLGLEQSLLSHHLKVLREAGLVRSRRDGKAVLYTVAEGVRQTDAGTEIDLGCCQLLMVSGIEGRGQRAEGRRVRGKGEKGRKF